MPTSLFRSKRAWTNQRPNMSRLSFELHSLLGVVVREDETPKERYQREGRFACMIIKIIILVAIWLFFAIMIMLEEPHDPFPTMLMLQAEQYYNYTIKEPTGGCGCIAIELSGEVNEESAKALERALRSHVNPIMFIRVQRFNAKSNNSAWESPKWSIYLADMAKNKVVKKYFTIAKREESADEGEKLQLAFLTDLRDEIVVSLIVNLNPVPRSMGIWAGFVLLCLLYVLIIFDVVDRTFAALLTSSAAIAVLCVMHARPTLTVLISWIDWETMMLLFGMMIMVAILSETGVFDYFAVRAYKYSGGNTWPLIFFLCFFAGILSAFLDNVTIVLLMVPVTVRLCEALTLRPNYVLITVALFSNLGGTMTPVGDPPNVIIATNHYVKRDGITFMNFTVHMLPGVLISMIIAFILVYFMLRNILYVRSEAQVEQMVVALEKQAERQNAQPMPTPESLRKAINERIAESQQHAQHAKFFSLKPVPNFERTLDEMQKIYVVRDRILLIKCAVVLCLTIVLFFAHSLPFMKGFTLAWIAIMCAILLLILANLPDLNAALMYVEWSTLLFFAALFIFMEALAEMGLIDWLSCSCCGLAPSSRPLWTTYP
ncbi:P protein-like [Drosophila busckii]|uniref:P protein-like n=1 Tax=Drosophila busckii TaxID=30019 RepID=UPI00083F311D|nr:P protein-like [Drosophila busckii]